MLPQEARLRNLTYASPLYLGITKRIMEGRERSVADRDDEEIEEDEDRKARSVSANSATRPNKRSRAQAVLLPKEAVTPGKALSKRNACWKGSVGWEPQVDEK